MLPGPLCLPACLCWQLAAKFNELRQVVSLTQIKIMLMNKARAREREKERKIVCRHNQITAKDDGNVLFVLCFSFCLMSAWLRRGGNANPDRDSTSLLPACHMASSSACSAASAAPVTPTTPLINFAVAFFAYFCFAFHFRNTKFLLSLCLIFVFHFSLCTALIWWRHNAALSLARQLSLSRSISEARPLPLCVLCVALPLSLSTSSPLSLPPAASAFA